MCNGHDHDHDHDHDAKLTRRQALTGSAAMAAAATTLTASGAQAQDNPYAPPAEPFLPPSDMVLDLSRAALVVTDPQVDFLSPDGVAWGAVGDSVKRNNTVANIERSEE